MNPGLTRPLKINDKVWSKRLGYGKVQTLEEYYKFDTRGKSIWLKT